MSESDFEYRILQINFQVIKPSSSSGQDTGSKIGDAGSNPAHNKV